MTTTAVPSAWPAPLASFAEASRAPWRDARTIDSEGEKAVEWRLSRNCSLAPRQLMAVYLSICAVSLGIAGVFSVLGATPVLAFAGLELAVLGGLLLLHARHAADRETITLRGDALHVEHRCGDRIDRAEFHAAWVRVTRPAGRGALVALESQGRHVQVGRYVRAEWRGLLAQELKRALGALPVRAQPESN